MAAIYGGYQAQTYAPQQYNTGWNPSCPCYPPQRGQNELNWNLPNATVGQHGFLGLQDTKGFALDLNGSGRYERGRDGVLAFDINRDGRTTPQEIEQSRNMLNSFGGNYDKNGDGRVTPCERAQGRATQDRVSQQYDLNHNGVLENFELARGGAHVLVDSNRDGKTQNWEQHSVYNFPVPGQGRGRLDFVDPYAGVNGVNVQQPWFYGPRPY